MYHPCSAPVDKQEPYNQATLTNSYSAFPMHSGTVPSKNPMPYGAPNTENGPLINSVGQMPNQSTQVQSASVPPTSQVVNNQDYLQDLESQLVVFREKEISLNEETNQLEEEKTVTFESLSTEKNKNLALEANISEFQVKVANLESELKTANENFSSITSDIACSKETYELKLKEFETALEVMKSDNDNLSSQIKDFIKTETALKETIKRLEAEKENMSENLLREIKKAGDLQINIDELKANLSTRESVNREICDREKIICTEVKVLRRTYELSQKINTMHFSQNQNHTLLTANTPPHPANTLPQPPVSKPPSLNYQPYWQQQPPRLPHNHIYPPTNRANKPPPYSNGTGFVPPVSQYGHPPNSGMHARYLPSSLSSNITQSNVPSSTGATQFNQASNTLLPQNRMGSLPQPSAARKRRLDPNNIPSPISCSTTDTNSISYCNTSSASMPSPLSKRKCITTEKNIMDILRCKPLVFDEWIIACYKDNIQMWYSTKKDHVSFIDDCTKQFLSIDEHPELMERFKQDFSNVVFQLCTDEIKKQRICLNHHLFLMKSFSSRKANLQQI